MGLTKPPILLLLVLLLPSVFPQDCSRSAYTRCVRIADPLVREAHLVFPDNLRDIDVVCKTWSRFVECIDRYTALCFTDLQLREFKNAVRNPMESVHKMCLEKSYQEEYLRQAPCIKSTITERSHCGPVYSLLVEQVEQGGVISKTTLCCSYDKFKECVQRETRTVCDRGIADGAAADFSSQILDKAFSFLQDQCYNYIPNSGDCPTVAADSAHYFDPSAVSVSSSEVYPWSTVQEAAAKEIPSNGEAAPTKYTSISWMPSTVADQGDSRVLGSRSRPASYGRSQSWSGPPATNDLRGYSEVTPSTHANWEKEVAVPSSWSPSASPDEQSLSSTAWYPVAGNQLVNEADEPNQQGLSKPKNGASRQLFSLTIVATVLTTYC